MELMAHQRKAVQRYADQSVIPLFFAVGTGKTITALSIVAEQYRRGLIDRVLVIAPNNIDVQWADEQIPLFCSDFDPELPVYLYHNTKPKAKFNVIPYRANALNICCVNIDKFSYASLKQRYVDWALAGKTCIVIDEATRIKNPKASRTRSMLYDFSETKWRGKTCTYNKPLTASRIILTGTPTTGSPADVWSLFEFLQPGYFGMGEYQFRARYTMQMVLRDKEGKVMCDGRGMAIKVALNEDTWKRIKGMTFEQAQEIYGITPDTYAAVQEQTKFEGAYKHVEELRQAMMKTASFVRIEDVQDMPEKRFIRKLLEMSKEQAQCYKSMKNELIAVYKDKEMRAQTKLTVMLRLQQIASGFISSLEIPNEEDFYNEEEDYFDEEGYKAACEKFIEDPPASTITWFDKKPKIDQLLVDVEELQGAPVLIVTHFSAEASMIYDTLKEAGYSVCLQTGWKKVGTIEEYKQGKYQVLVANEHLISMGFNLQHGHYIIFYSNTFSLEDRLQTEGRIYRTGQKNTCFYIDYVMEDTVDMAVFESLALKKNLSDYIINKSAEELLR